MRAILLLFMALSLIGCEVKTTAKKFLFENPDVTFRINGNDTVYNLYTPKGVLSNLKCKNEIVTFYIGQKTYEVLLTGNEQRIGDTEYFVRADIYQTRRGMLFRVAEQKIKTKEVKSKKETLKKEKKVMSLSLGNWIILVIVMVIIAKVAHKISLKTIFKPSKKTVSHIKQEWKDS